MGLQQFQSDAPLRAQRMTADEAASVIALWQQEQTESTGLTDRPAVPDVAEGLGITVEDVQRLLEAVRAQRRDEERVLVQEQELAAAEMRLADEERRLAEIQGLRAKLGREDTGQRIRSAEPVPWEIWKAAQEAETESGAWRETSPDFLEHDRLESQHESSILASVWKWIIIIFVALFILSSLFR